MCGFAGIIGNGSCEMSILENMINTLHHRGPDSLGFWFDDTNQVGLSFARLSILDLSSAGSQPMKSNNGKYIIVYNGEVYNHLDLRNEIYNCNFSYNWKGHSDTETLLAGFEIWGIEKTIQKTVGMFAFAVWNTETKILTLGRDRFGEKPLYYGWQGNTFLFASELKAIKKHPNFASRIKTNSVSDFIQFGYIPAPNSIYEGIYKLMPGNLLKIDPTKKSEDFVLKPYWSLIGVALKGINKPFESSEFELINQLENLLVESINSQQISDVSIGSFLSGGIDSSIITAIMQSQSKNPINTFTIGFEEDNYNEAKYAEKIADYLKTDHTEYYVSSKEAQSVIPMLPNLYDEPFADSSQIPTYLVSKLAKKNVTVCLSGDAGDELFGGYNRYIWAQKFLKIPYPLRKISSSVINIFSPEEWDKIYEITKHFIPQKIRLTSPGNKVHKLAGILSINTINEIYTQLVSICPKSENLLINDIDNVNLKKMWETIPANLSPENKMMLIDSLTYLPDDILCKVDRAAMGVSLETRAPFLDHRLADFAWQLPMKYKIRDGQNKWILRQILYKYIPKDLFERPKMGFGIPLDSWLRGPLREWAEELLDESKIEKDGYLNPKKVRQKWEEHLTEKKNWQHQLWNILMFQSWLNKN